MQEFVSRMGLISLWQEHPVDFTHLDTDNKSTSTLDHFLVSPSLLPLVSGCGVIHRGDNMSRHSPIWLKINLRAPLPLRKKVVAHAPRKPSWPKATDADVFTYTAALTARINNLQVPESMLCTDCKCTNPMHSQERDNLTLDILLAVVEITHISLPLSGESRQS